MRSLLRMLLLPLLLCLQVTASAQVQTLSGTVVSTRDGSPLEGATVQIKGSTLGTPTDSKGNFSLNASKGAVLVVSYLGYTTKEYTVGDKISGVTIGLAPAENALEEVVVALDLKRKPRELGYSTQKVLGSELQETQRENFINGLQGRVAGLTISPTGGTAGASSSVVLRGFNSLSLSNEPLFVIDGIIMDNSTVNETSGGGAGLGLASDRANRNNDYTNRISDLNPNDIESITVLKGPEATALYGSQASSGAILVTTKKAKSNKLAVQYDNAFRVQQITRYPEVFEGYQNGENGANANVFRYFGEPYPAGTNLIDNKKNFFKTGFAQTHNLGADFGFNKSVFRVSGSYFNQEGVVPNNNFKRINLRIANTTKIGKYIEITPSLAYVRSENDKVLRSAGGYMLGLFAYPNTYDIRRYQDDAGNKIPVFASNNPNAELDNPLFNVNANPSRDETDRYTASLGINITPTDWLTLTGRFGYDTYKTEGYTLYHPKSFYITQALNGEQDNYWREYKGYNHTITATAKKDFGKWSTRLMVGTMWQDYNTQMFAIVGNNLKDPTKFDSSNTAPNTRRRLLQNNLGNWNESVTRQMAGFGEVSVGYNNVIFFNYSHRFEAASTLPKINRNYNYPGASLSVIISDIFPELKRGSTLNYWKIRTSAASTARLNSPYSTQSVFVDNFASGGGFSYGFVNNNPNLEPEKQQTFEVGTELKLFNNILNFDATYYNTLNKGQIVEGFRLSYATGFVLNTQNAGSTRNQGFEVSADANVINQADFGWNVRVNFNKMWNEVVQLPANVAEYYLGDTWLYGNARGGITLNGTTTSITSYGYLRNTAGDILINPLNGLPAIDAVFKVRGDRNPDFTIGTTNTFRYKNWRLSFLWDLKVGGDVFNANQMYLTGIGKSNLTIDRYTPRVIEGVLNDGKQNSANPTRNTITVIPAYLDAYYGANGMPEEAFIEKDVNWLRLRDLTLNYQFSPNVVKKIRGVKSLGAFITGNDLILITNYTGGDPASNGNTAAGRGVGAWGFDYGTLPTPISINIGIRASF
ncbi:SusC/RagA family TonB-linked outer membrane protein [Flavitalea antarctica]